MASSSLKHEVNISKDLESSCDYTLLITGVTGNGKSSLCNFLSCSNTAFETNNGFASVTEKSAAAIITMQGKRVKLIDTPGFCDDYETEEEHMKEFGEALVLAAKGVNAIGLVISARARYTTNDRSTIDQLSEFPELWPYMFILFTHANSLGTNEEEQNKNLQSTLEETRCPPSLKDLMQKVHNRYILFESIKPSDDPEEYYQRKTKELQAMTQNISEANDQHLYTNELFIRAKALLDQLIEDKAQNEKELKLTRSITDENIQQRQKDETAVKESNLEVQMFREKQKKLEIERDEKLKCLVAGTEEEVKQKEKEREEMRKDLDKQHQEKQLLEKKIADEKELKLKQEAIESMKKQLEEERKKHNSLKSDMSKEVNERPNKKWFKFLFKKPKENNS